MENVTTTPSLLHSALSEVEGVRIVLISFQNIKSNFFNVQLSNINLWHLGEIIPGDCDLLIIT